MASKANKDDFDRLGEQLKKIAQQTAARKKQSKPLVPTNTEISAMVKEGQRLLDEEAKVKAAVKEKGIATAKATKANPYLTARNIVLAEYPEWRRKELLDMESKGDKNNSRYNDFVRAIIREGDKLTS
jgi:predicted lipid-binding transport protein (Tim44 family)